MDKIKIKINGRVAEIESAPEVVTDNAEYEVEFAVDERDGWNPAVPMTALFVRRDARYTAVVMDVGETICTMPPQTGTNIVYVGLTQDDLRTTTPATIKVHRSIRTVAHDPLPAPTEDVYAQILAAYAGVKVLSGKGAPTSVTQGKVNQLYRDEDTQKLYICTATSGGYTWAAVVSDTEDAVTYTAQTLTEGQKTQARANIGAGTSNFSGSYNDLTNKPNIPAASVIDTTLSKSGQAADAKAAGDAIGRKLDATALPTAVNDALAQAKASGEFDGAKGDKGDTGPEGPKGADGKDGAGMDITGAKVGQIAKITAVDAAGKPTGWEPVDMPSGEDDDTFELINTIELTESANFIQISQDANGNALSLKEAYIVCVSVFVADDTDNVFTNIKIKVNGKTATNNKSPKFETMFPRYTAAYAKIVPQETILAGIESSGFNANWTFSLESMGRLNNIGSTITSIELNPNDGLKCIGSAGTKVYLYGVRS